MECVCPNINLRPAHIGDLDILQHWDRQEHIVLCDPDGNENWEYELQRFPTWREQLIAELDGRPIGCIQIIDPAEEESHYWGDVPAHLRAIDIWIGELDDIDKGYGTEMMRQAIERCFANAEVTDILIDPLETNVAAIRFYEQLGFRFVEKRSFGGSDCLVYRLGRKERGGIKN